MPWLQIPMEGTRFSGTVAEAEENPEEKREEEDEDEEDQEGNSEAWRCVACVKGTGHTTKVM